MSRFNNLDEFFINYNNVPIRYDDLLSSPNYYNPFYEISEYEKEKIRNRIEKKREQNYYRELLDKQIRHKKMIESIYEQLNIDNNNNLNRINNNIKKPPSPFIINAGLEIISGNKHKKINENYRNELLKQIEENKKRRLEERKKEIAYDLQLERENRKFFEMKERQRQEELRREMFISNYLNPNNRFFSFRRVPIFDDRQNNNLFEGIEEEESLNNINIRELEQNEGNIENENESNEDINNLIKRLPINKLKDVNNLSSKECVICMENFAKGDKIISLPCIHIFHANCIKSWLIKEKICPICKFKVGINE